MAIVGGPEWKCVVLARRHDGSHAHLALYFQVDLAGLLWPAAVARESRKRPLCSHRPDRTLRFVASGWICGYPSALWWRTRALEFSKQRIASARRGSHRSDHGDDHRALCQRCIRTRPLASVPSLWTTTFTAARARFPAATVASRLGLRLVLRSSACSPVPMADPKERERSGGRANQRAGADRRAGPSGFASDADRTRALVCNGACDGHRSNSRDCILFPMR